MKPTNIFMTCEWKDLIISTFEVDKSILEPYLPINTELDLFNGKALISLVAFTFSKVKFFGIKVPFHQHFGQINFRFYAKSKTDGSRGVVFIREFAPKHLIALVGNKIYNEPYFFKAIGLKKLKKGDRIELQYNYKVATIKAKAGTKTDKLQKNSLKHFVVDRYIAFIKSKKRKTVRYNIYHKPWEIHQMDSSNLDSKLLDLLPANFKNLKHLSTYLVNGSEVQVQKGMLQ
ncbi:DUF2071 domain-containing protein [Seonamhaeicola sp.]|uniref:DUF2071 domain-containing protein n=1 Tax=Seonamhaeicola sp. TaxID=1912245 RepID=UPI002637CB65|nr:DUF2071 domain-containing protein [Seonamhaeicola sp.]